MPYCSHNNTDLFFIGVIARSQAPEFVWAYLPYAWNTQDFIWTLAASSNKSYITYSKQDEQSIYDDVGDAQGVEFTTTISYQVRKNAWAYGGQAERQSYCSLKASVIYATAPTDTNVGC